MEIALARSINTVAVRIAQAVGPELIIQTARRLGVTSRLSSDLSIALGTSEVSLFEMTAAYLPFANGGIAYPFGIQRIRSKTGTTLYERSNSSLGRIVESRHVGQMNKMLSTAVTSGTGRKANMKAVQRPETGTSQDYRDSWFIGYTADLVAASGLATTTTPPPHGSPACYLQIRGDVSSRPQAQIRPHVRYRRLTLEQTRLRAAACGISWMKSAGSSRAAPRNRRTPTDDKRLQSSKIFIATIKNSQ